MKAYTTALVMLLLTTFSIGRVNDGCPTGETRLSSAYPCSNCPPGQTRLSDTEPCYRPSILPQSARQATSAAQAGQSNTWTDPQTGLMWARQDNGSNVNWNQATEYCRRLSLAGYRDWRLPTTDELAAIYDNTQTAKATQSAFDVHIKGRIRLSTGFQWSSSINDIAGAAYGFGFDNGRAGFGDSTPSRALCVRRSGKSGGAAPSNSAVAAQQQAAASPATAFQSLGLHSGQSQAKVKSILRTHGFINDTHDAVWTCGIGATLGFLLTDGWQPSGHYVTGCYSKRDGKDQVLAIFELARRHRDPDTGFIHEVRTDHLSIVRYISTPKGGPETESIYGDVEGVIHNPF